MAKPPLHPWPRQRQLDSTSGNLRAPPNPSFPKPSLWHHGWGMQPIRDQKRNETTAALRLQRRKRWSHRKVKPSGTQHWSRKNMGVSVGVGIMLAIPLLIIIHMIYSCHLRTTLCLEIETNLDAGDSQAMASVPQMRNRSHDFTVCRLWIIWENCCMGVSTPWGIVWSTRRKTTDSRMQCVSTRCFGNSPHPFSWGVQQ